VLSAEEVAKLPGEVWRAAPHDSGAGLRVPVSGTLDALIARHDAFLNRMPDGDRFRPVPPLTEFRVVPWRRAIEPVSRPWVAFQILRPDAAAVRPFDTARRLTSVAAWVRHATGEVCQDWPWQDCSSFVHGHNPDGSPVKGATADERFMYLPLPSIERRGDLGENVGAIRRVLITAPAGFGNRIDWIRRRLSGQDLVWDGNPVGMLTVLARSDWVLQQYTGESCEWSTVTPVVLPGHDDRDPRKAEALLRKAMVQAGLPPELVSATTDLEWRGVGFRPGLEMASRYQRPKPLHGPMYHVRVRFPAPVRGPLAVGAGRYRGFGLFAFVSN
jgi:CRISPR-associated protein Csb2